MRPKRQIPLKTDPTFAFVVDGECEVWYLQMLKRYLRSVRLSILPLIPQKKSIAEQYKMVEGLATDYTRVFWILDLDAVLQQTKEAKKGAKSPLHQLLACKTDLEATYDNVVVIFNSPCIEYFFLLHFEPTSKYFKTCLEAEKQLKKHLPEYEKTRGYFTHRDHDIFTRLRPHLAQAIQNSLKTGTFSPESPFQGLSEMHKLFDVQEWKKHFVKK